MSNEHHQAAADFAQLITGFLAGPVAELAPANAPPDTAPRAPRPDLSQASGSTGSQPAVGPAAEFERILLDAIYPTLDGRAPMIIHHRHKGAT